MPAIVRLFGEISGILLVLFLIYRWTWRYYKKRSDAEEAAKNPQEE